MKTQDAIDYQRIAKAIDYIIENFQDQPSTEQIAQSIHLSASHFKRIFTKWAGTTPKRFLQYISIQYAKSVLKQKQATLLSTSIEAGFSSTSRLHDLFISIEGMTPLEYKNGGKNLCINYSFASSLFGNLLIASTQKGICYMAFVQDEIGALQQLKAEFPNAILQQKTDQLQQNALGIFHKDWRELPQIKLHLKATDFQLKVWESLLTIPLGSLCTYGSIAQKIGNAKACRAVGSAIGSNPVAFLIPCHRVIQSSGNFGGYKWQPNRKTALIGWEAAQVNE
ncbi:methylated-DNA--[protein]-cysteine S-methyltransferase [Myroides sp. LJL116]